MTTHPSCWYCSFQGIPPTDGVIRIDCKSARLGRVHGEIRFKNCSGSSVSYG